MRRPLVWLLRRLFVAPAVVALTVLMWVTLPGWLLVTPWSMTSGSQFRQGSPPTPLSPEYTDAFHEVERLGKASSLHRSADQTQIALFWADGAGTVCQVDRSDCEIILCQDSTRKDKGRLFIELTGEGRAAFRRELAERSVPSRESWWGYDVVVVDDPDGNELLFPDPD